MNISLFVLQALYLMLPAYFANMAPVLFRKCFCFLAKPVDFGFKFRGRRLFGSHKTWRGLLVGTLFGIIIAYIQFIFWPSFKMLSVLNYNNWFLIGFALGAGALIGDLLKSMIKRQVGIKEGKRFVPWDQLDFVFGSLLFLSIVQRIDFNYIFILILISPFLHIITNHIAFYLKIRKEKW